MPTMTIAAAKIVLMIKPMKSSPTGTISNTSDPDEVVEDKSRCGRIIHPTVQVGNTGALQRLF